MPVRYALLDLDGTVADYDKAVQEGLAELRHPDEPLLDWSRDTEPPWVAARRRLITLRPGFWRELPRIEAGFEIYRALLEIGYHVTVLTKGPSRKPNGFRTGPARKSAAWSEKVEWCDIHLPEAEVTITENKAQSYGRVLVDDWGPYVMPWLEHRPRGLVVMPAQPWNEGIVHPRIYRYTGDQDRLRIVLHAAYVRENHEPLVLPAA